MRKRIIAMAGGGTGGHVFPIRSLLETLFKTPSYASQVEKIYRLGSSHSLEQQIAKELLPTTKKNGPQFRFLSIFSGKFRRQKTIKAYFQNFKDLIFFTVGFFQSLRYLRHYHVDTVFCKGGYVALPVVFAAKVLGRKIIVHESDVHPGVVNRIASKFASATFTGFDGVLPHATTVGQILSDDIVPNSSYGPRTYCGGSIQKKHNSSPVELQGRNDDKPTVFIMGGSQGSQTLYETFAQLLETNPVIASAFNFYLSLGKLNANLKSRFTQKNVQVFDFLSQKEMGEMYQKSDICLARGGTTSLAEQKLFNIKSIIVPIPRTHDQMDNAKRYVHHYQDILLDQTSPNFLSEMEKILLSLKTYKKPPMDKDIFTEIQQAKKLIIEEMLK